MFHSADESGRDQLTLFSCCTTGQSLGHRKRSESESMGQPRQSHKPFQQQQQQMKRVGSGRIRHGSGEPANYPPARRNRIRSQSFTENTATAAATASAVSSAAQ